MLEFPIRADSLSDRIGSRLVGDPDLLLHGFSSLENPEEGTVSFLAARSYMGRLANIQKMALLTREELVCPELPLTFLVVPDPRQAFAKLTQAFIRTRPGPGIAQSAEVNPSAQIAPTASIGRFVIVEESAIVGQRSVIHPFVYIGKGVRIGEDCEIGPQTTLWDFVTIGNRVQIGTGSVIGSEGFGFFISKGETTRTEMPQIGSVVIEDEVRVGALCTVDRATLGVTRIEKGTKIDNHVHIGHNCRIGKNVILCAQVGLGGSVVIEDEAQLGGQVGIGHGVRVGMKARMGGQSGSGTNIKGGETYFLTPAIPIREVTKITRYFRKLPEIWNRLGKIEKRIGMESSE